MDAPVASVVVPTHERPARLQRLLDALEEQSFPLGQFEVIVVHHGEPRTLAVLGSHPLADDGVLRVVAVDSRNSGPSAKRNAGWREARGATVVFTDDDCRPPARWLERIVSVAVENPGDVVQGATRPDPEESWMLERPGSKTLRVEPPSPWGQTANIAYPRGLLDRLGGFDEGFLTPGGEDAELLYRALEEGAGHVAAPEALTHHAVDVLDLAARLRVARRWGGAVLLVKRHRAFRRHAVLGIFWRASHAWLALALLGLTLGRRWRPALALALPYVVLTRPPGTRAPVARLRALGRLPATALVDLVELVTLAEASVRYRTALL